MKTVFTLHCLQKVVLENKLAYDASYTLQDELPVKRDD